MLLGYIVYLAVALFTGELLENSVELFLVYFPDWKQYLYDLFNLNERMLLRKSRISRSGPQSMTDMGGLQLFDDDQKPNHIVGADMTFNSEQPTATKVQHGDHADFGMGLRPSEMSEV